MTAWLVDTDALLWFLTDDPKLSTTAKHTMESGAHVPEIAAVLREKPVATGTAGGACAIVASMTVDELVPRLLAIEVSALCDADKTLPVVDPAVHAIVADVRMAGPAFPVLAEDDHLPVMSALAEAAAGEVLVIATNGGAVAVLGELIATEARRRGIAGVVIDGFCRDVAGLRRVGLPVFARGTIPRSGTAVARPTLGAPLTCGGVEVARGDVVFGDDDGVVIAPAARVAAALDTAEAIGRTERAMLDGMARGRSLHEQTNWAEHVAALDAGEPSALEFRVDAD